MMLSFDDWVLQGGITDQSRNRPDDVFIVAGGFEERATAISALLSPEYNARRALLYLTEETLSGRCHADTLRNVETIRGHLTEHGIEVMDVNGSWLDSRRQFAALKTAIAALPSGSDDLPLRVTLDSTGFNREALLHLLILLWSMRAPLILRVFYCAPESHGDWLSRGYRKIRTVSGYPGVQQASKKLLLIGLSGYESDRILKIIDEYEPQKVLLGIGDPPIERIFLKRNIEEQNLILGRRDVERFSFPLNDLFGCVTALSDRFVRYRDEYNIVLAPMSTKFSTFAAFLAAAEHKHVQLVYCVPGEYNCEDYSRGVKGVQWEEVSLACEFAGSPEGAFRS